MRGLELVAVVAATRALRAARLRRALPRTSSRGAPRRFRVLSALPATPTGKLMRADLVALSMILERSRRARPVPAQRGEHGETLFEVPADSPFFEGHFDGAPVLPGVVQLWHVALREARRQHPDLGPLARVTRVKFKRTIAPGETLAVRLDRKGPHVVHFTLDSAARATASGILHFRGEARPACEPGETAREPGEDAT